MVFEGGIWMKKKKGLHAIRKPFTIVSEQRTISFFTVPAKITALLADQLGEKVHCANQLAHIAHFIVVPTYRFHQLGIAYGYHFGLGGIEQRSEMDANDVAAYQFFFGVAEAFVGGGFHCGVHFVNSYFFAQYRRQFCE